MEKKKEKKNALGGFALVFAFALPIVGFILGIISIVVSKGDTYLRKDGIFAVVISIVATAVHILFLYTIFIFGITASLALM